MKAAVSLLAILMLLGAAGASGERGYRVSGVVGQEGSWLLAAIEEPDGVCRIYRTGDPLGSGRIVEVTPQGVLVELAGSIHFLKLEGSAFIAKPQEAGPAVIRSGTSNPVAGELSREDLKDAVANVAAELARDPKLPFDPQVMNALLSLSAQARITAVNGQSVSSPSDSVRVLNEALNRNTAPRITYSEGGEAKEIYLMPAATVLPHQN